MKFSFDFFKKMRRRNVRIVTPSLMHPLREWFVGLSLALLILAAGAAYAGQFLLRHLGDDRYSGGGEETVTTYKASVVQSVLETYRGRSETFDMLRTAPAVGPIITPNTGGSVNGGAPIGAE